jgi:hypothetical protein
MRKIIVSSKKKINVPKKFHPEHLTNNLLIDSGFKKGIIGYMKYANGKLTIILSKKIPQNYL